MIRLFVSDIDGCLGEPYRPLPLERLHELAAFAAAAGAGGNGVPLPPLTLLSGRAYPYVEAMTQLLGLCVPVLFESGGGMFDLPTARITWNPAFTAELDAALDDVRAWLKATCLPGTGLSFDYGKRTQAGVVGPDVDEVARFVPVVERYVAEHHPALVVTHTAVSIDVLAAAITKRQALDWLADATGVALDEMAYIGDAVGDVEALRAVGRSFAPANAVAAVKAVVDVVTAGAVADGVLEAYRACAGGADVPQLRR